MVKMVSYPDGDDLERKFRRDADILFLRETDDQRHGVVSSQNGNGGRNGICTGRCLRLVHEQCMFLSFFFFSLSDILGSMAYLEAFRLDRCHTTHLSPPRDNKFPPCRCASNFDGVSKTWDLDRIAARRTLWLSVLCSVEQNAALKGSGLKTTLLTVLPPDASLVEYLAPKQVLRRLSWDALDSRRSVRPSTRTCDSLPINLALPPSFSSYGGRSSQAPDVSDDKRTA